MAATAASDLTEGPVLSLITKRLRALRKKHNRILQMEESVSQGKPLNKEQEEVLRTKPSVTAAIDELEKLRQPLAAAVADEISLAVQNHQNSAPPSLNAATASDSEQTVADTESKEDREYSIVEDLLNLLYFGTMFDVKSQNDFTSTMLTRTHERGCCLTYDYVTDDENADMLCETDLDLISMLGSLLISRPVDSSFSHRDALQRCIVHAKQWLVNSDQPINSDPSVTYAGLKAKLNKIMASDYFTTTPEMKATVEMAAAAVGNYAAFQVPVHGSMVPVSVPVLVEGSDEQYQQKDEDATNFEGNEAYDNQSSPVEEPHKGEFESENTTEIPSQTELDEQQTEGQNQRDVESKDNHYAPRRNFQNQRGGRGGEGGRRGYPNGRVGRGSSRGGGGYQNGRNQYYDQPGNYYPRNYHYNNRGRGGRGGGGGDGNFYNNHSSGAEASYAPADS
ncbi:uncharacterized protein LOC130779580 [Actinidia eriantha]|uniref:uncharacterized protein LOC130779580 n=1 Tax=Actinidia eriantha TaxID=165200 RepID=UPI0025852535|nr:uncharacterized protein LOC130779580 [Actinidia eriantha]